jgi:hypothetical protein
LVFDAMSATNHMMKDVVAAFAPALKSAGYRKQAARFRRDASPTVVQLVDIQSSQWNVDSEGQFTVNLGVYHRDLEALHDASPVVESPLVHDCLVQQRIGFLMPVGRDFWWPINPTTDLTGLGEKVGAAWVQYGKPWLEAKSTLEGAREHLLKEKHYFLVAMASCALGNPDDAHQWLDKAVEDWPEGNERIEAWRTAHLAPLRRRRRRTKR